MLSFKVKRTSPEATSRKDNWCWEQSFIDVDVGAEDVKGVEFVQKGYWVNVISTHDVDAYMIQPDGSHVPLKIKVVSLFAKNSQVEIYTRISAIHMHCH